MFPSARLSFLTLLVAVSAHAAALSPLTAEEARTLPTGHAEIVFGTAYFDGLRFPLFRQAGAASRQSLLAVPQFGARIAAGDWAEIQATYELLRLEESVPGSRHVTRYGSGDARLFTKVMLLREQAAWPAVGLRFGTKLPNANRQSQLGTDEIDFGSEALLSKRLGPVAAHANLGLLLLGNPGPSRGQDDVFAYALAAASPPLLAAADHKIVLEWLGEFSGLAGSRFDNDRHAFRTGVQLHTAVVTVFAGFSVGLVAPSEDIGAAVGLVCPIDFGADAGEPARPQAR